MHSVSSDNSTALSYHDNGEQAQNSTCKPSVDSAVLVLRKLFILPLGHAGITFVLVWLWSLRKCTFPYRRDAEAVRWNADATGPLYLSCHVAMSS